MKSIETYFNFLDGQKMTAEEINEALTHHGKWVQLVSPSDENPDIDDYRGKDAERNGSHGLFGVDEPTEEDMLEENQIDLNSDENTEAVEELIDKFDAEDDFFIEGEAGWGKTSIIEKLAKQYGRTIITVYLDKAEATDLGGIPIPRENKRNGSLYQDYAMPIWAKIIDLNPDIDFLLFFDEMNQAQPDVMNALMPIVLKHEICGQKMGPRDSKGKVTHSNFLVGAAGNLKEENKEGVSALSGPLESRFKPIIRWNSGDPKSWGQAFSHLHKKWDSKLGVDFVNIFQENTNLYQNPREIEMKIFQFTYNLATKDSVKSSARNKAEKYYRRLFKLVNPGMLNAAGDALKSQSDDQTLSKQADTMQKFIASSEFNEDGTLKDSAVGGGVKKKKSKVGLNSTDVDFIKSSMERGYAMISLQDETTKKTRLYPMLFTEENYGDYLDVFGDIMLDTLEAQIDLLHDEGVEFKFKSREDAEKQGVEVYDVKTLKSSLTDADIEDFSKEDFLKIKGLTDKGKDFIEKGLGRPKRSGVERVCLRTIVPVGENDGEPSFGN